MLPDGELEPEIEDSPGLRDEEYMGDFLGFFYRRMDVYSGPNS